MAITYRLSVENQLAQFVIDDIGHIDCDWVIYDRWENCRNVCAAIAQHLGDSCVTRPFQELWIGVTRGQAVCAAVSPILLEHPSVQDICKASIKMAKVPKGLHHLKKAPHLDVLSVEIDLARFHLASFIARCEFENADVQAWARDMKILLSDVRNIVQV